MKNQESGIFVFSKNNNQKNLSFTFILLNVISISQKMKSSTTFLLCLLLFDSSFLLKCLGLVPSIRRVNRQCIRPYYTNVCFSSFSPTPQFHQNFGLYSSLSSLSDEKSFQAKLSTRWRVALHNMKSNPWPFISIPISAAFIGYITNWIGVNMLFYPVKWTGIPLVIWPNEPLGILGWQGIVPAKRIAMATRMVDVTISRLLKVSEIFSRLEPRQLAALLVPTVLQDWWYVPKGLKRILLRIAAQKVIKSIESCVDIKHLVVSGLTKDPLVLIHLFQKVGKNELKYLVNSGFSYGFLLGLFQLIFWMFYPKNWTLPIGGAVIGYITNWIALKNIFEPLNPTKIGPFVIQGLFLQRQRQVSEDFSAYISEKVLTSQSVWASILSNPRFEGILRDQFPLRNLPSLASKVLLQLKEGVNNNRQLHEYTTTTLNLKETLRDKMNTLSTSEFEQVLHPIFQEDELTLIIAGGVLGGLSGLLQWMFNNFMDAREKKRQSSTVNSNSTTKHNGDIL